MHDLPLVSIVVLNYDGLQHLETCFSSVFKTNYPRYEVIFVDNGSSDGSVDFVKKNYSSVRIIRIPRNIGPAGGFNAGIINANGKYVATLNNDIELDPDWLLPLVIVMEKNPDVAAVDSKYLNFFNHSNLDTRSAAGRFLDFVANPLTTGAGDKDRSRYDKILRVFYSCTMFRRDAVIDAGMFDEDFFYWYEDADLGWRLNLRGHRVMYVPDSRIYHKSGETKFQDALSPESRLRSRFYFLNKRNKLIILIKNYSLTTLLRFFPLILFEHIGYVFYWALKGDKQYCLESFQALLWTIKSFKMVWKKHLQTQQLKKIDDDEIMSLMSPYCGDPLKFVQALFASN